MLQRRRAVQELEQEFIDTSNAPGTQINKDTHLSRYLAFCDFNKMKLFPTNEFKISKFVASLTETVKMVDSIKAYCATICEQNELKGHRPVRRGIKFYKVIAGIRKNLRHTVKRA